MPARAPRSVNPPPTPGTRPNPSPVLNYATSNNTQPKAGNVDFSGKNLPNNPGYFGTTDATGNLQSQYVMNPSLAAGGGNVGASTYAATLADPAAALDRNAYNIAGFGDVNTDPAALNAIKEQAMNAGPSAWAQVANQGQALNQRNAQDAQSQTSAGAEAQAQARMAQYGGADAGSSERLALASQRANAFAQNAILNSGNTDKVNINLADQANKNSMLMAIPGFQNQDAQLKLANQQQQIGVNEYNAGNQFGVDTGNANRTTQNNQFNAGVSNTANQYNAGATQAANTFNSSQLQALNLANALSTNQANSKNIDSLTANNAAQNAFNGTTYGQQLAAYASGRTANATAGLTPGGDKKTKENS